MFVINPNGSGDLVPPRFVVFETLGWKDNPFLLSKIMFKPSLIDKLAKEAGIDAAILDLLRRDPAIVAELVSRLSVNAIQEPVESTAPLTKSNQPKDDNCTKAETASGLIGGYDGPSSGIFLRGVNDNKIYPTHNQGSEISSSHDIGDVKEQGKRVSGNAGARPFVSYVGAHLDEDYSESDSLEQIKRMQIEAIAIELILAQEPSLQRTPDGNPGFDLFETGKDGRTIRWIEVKAMTGTLEDRPVGLSHTQFDCAREKGDAYWLYVVERATDPKQARVLRIQNPFGHARTFTFDHGWCEIAHTEPVSKQ